MTILASAALSLLILSAPATALTPGPEIQVNTTTGGDQYGGVIAADGSGGFSIAWHSDEQDGSDFGVYSRRFDSHGNPLTGEIAVNTTTAESQDSPTIAPDGSGGFWVAWRSYLQDGSSWGVFMRRFDATGAPLGGEIQVNTTTAGRQYGPAITPDGSGGFWIAWQSDEQDGDRWGIYARRFTATGVPRTGEVAVNATTVGSQLRPSVAPGPGGGLVVAWESSDPFATGQDGSGSGVFARRFDGSGLPLSGEIGVNQFTAENQQVAAVAPGPLGGFIVAWESFGQDGSGFGVYARRFDLQGNPLSAELPVHVITQGSQRDPAILPDPGGGFTVAWAGLDGSDTGVLARRFDAAGAPLGGETPVNEFTAGAQGGAELAADGRGGFTVAWSSQGQDGSGLGVYARRFAVPPGPVPPPPAPPAPAAPPVSPPAPRADRALGLEIAGKRLAVNRRGVARLRLRCPASEASPPCRGQLLLRTRAKLALGKGPKAKQRRIVLARASFRIPAGRTKAVKLRLGKAKLRLLKRTPRARKAQAIVRARDGAGNRRTVRKGLTATVRR